MSHFTSLVVQFKDPNALKKALVNLGFKEDQVEIHKNPVQLFDYCDQTTKYRFKDTQDERFRHGDLCHVVVRKRHVGEAQNDLGFFVDPKGESVSFICDFARQCDPKRIYNPKVQELGGFNKKFDSRLAQEYAFEVAKSVYEKKGKKVTRVDEKGKIKLYANV